jgi:hypothetical protein
LEVARVGSGCLYLRISKTLTTTLDLNDVLNSLPTAKDAPFNAYQRQHDPTCLPETRVNLLEETYNWVEGKNSPSIFWLNGLAGTGKSTVARTLVDKYSQKTNSVVASFFFSRNGGEGGHLRHARRFVTSIAVQLAHNVQPLKQLICDAISAHSDIADQALREQWRYLILDPLLKLGGDNGVHRCILVVDALDECEDENDIRTLLRLLAETRSVAGPQLRIFLTSRPEIPIRNAFIEMPNTEHQDFILHRISLSIVNNDILLFLQHELKLIACKYGLDTSWPGKQMIEQLVEGANGLFILAATACRFIDEGKIFAADRLSIILKSGSTNDSIDGFSSNDSSTDDRIDDPALAPEQHLDKLYITVLRNSIDKYRKPERKKRRKLLATTVGTIAVLSSPLSSQSLGRLLDTLKSNIDQTLNDLHAILDIPKDANQPLRLHHPSFRDFLLDKNRCEGLHFVIKERQVHQTLATSCLRLMSSSLKQDICGVEQPGVLVIDVNEDLIQQHIPLELQYACLHWVQHLQKSRTQLEEGDQVHQFLKKHLLHWLEALGWIGKVPEGVHAIVSLESMTVVS